MTHPRTLHRDAAGYSDLIASTVAGIPCLIGISSFVHVPRWRGSAMSCPSDADYYGYTEAEFDILDQRGRRAPWLAAKLTPSARDAIESEILCYYADLRAAAEIDRYNDSLGFGGWYA